MNAPVQIEAPEASRVPLTVEALRVLAEAGVYDDLGAEQELIDGVLVMVPPPGPGHWQAEAALVRLLVRAIDAAGLADQIVAQTGAGLQLDGTTLLGPDVMLRKAGPIREELSPADVPLVIEIAGTSLRRDRSDKALRYAAAGVPEYWVVDVQGQAVILHGRPADDGYRCVREAKPGDTIAPDLSPQITVAVAALF